MHELSLDKALFIKFYGNEFQLKEKHGKTNAWFRESKGQWEYDPMPDFKTTISEAYHITCKTLVFERDIEFIGKTKGRGKIPYT